MIRCGLARVGFQRQDSHGEIGDSDDVAVATSISSSTQVYYR
ncbi:hypothetical protein [Mycolicibacterium tusciae]|nr:hypothetical protein [Mycolicibacterium tusciae]